MLKDYQATTTGGGSFGKGASDDQYVVDVSRQVTQMTLSGTTVQATWVSPNNTLYALVVLDVDTFNDSISQMDDLSENIRVAVQERAEASFRELDKAVREN
jgi:hypothetical protein